MLIFFSDALNQANGCDHEPSDSSSDEGISSEEGDDDHSYAEFVKKNHVHFDRWGYSFSIFGDKSKTLSVESSLMACLTLQGKSNGSISTVDEQACSNLPCCCLWFFLIYSISPQPLPERELASGNSFVLGNGTELSFWYYQPNIVMLLESPIKYRIFLCSYIVKWRRLIVKNRRVESFSTNLFMAFHVH
jgi:hypothetical protein